MLGDTPALPGSPSQRLGWMSLETAQQTFLFDVYFYANNNYYGTALHNNNFVLSYVVTPPPPIISGSPRNTSFFQGLDLTLTCIITLGSVVDTLVTVQGIWNRNGIELMNDGRITVSPSRRSSPPYAITLRFNPLNVTDAGTYECHVTVTPQDSTFISTATISNSRSISISGMYNTIVSYTCMIFPLQSFRLKLLMSLLKASPQLDSLAIH